MDSGLAAGSFVDLHTHSTASDGTLSPGELVRAAKAAGLTALALTDHDTVAGCAEARAVAAEVGVDFLSGIEISCEVPRPATMHLLGYGVREDAPELHDLTRRLIEGRTTRNEKMVGLLREAGMEVTLEEVLAEAGGGTVGRPHLARIMIRKGYVKDTTEAFEKYLGQGGRFYVDKEVTTSRQAIEMIRRSGGIAVLAHPSQLKCTNRLQLETVIKGLVDQGLGGLETNHSDHTGEFLEVLEGIARKYGLVATGGSDFHGATKPSVALGKVRGRRVGREVYERVVERITGAS